MKFGSWTYDGLMVDLRKLPLNKYTWALAYRGGGDGPSYPFLIFLNMRPAPPLSVSLYASVHGIKTEKKK